MSGEFDRYAKSYDEVLVGSMPAAFAEQEYFARYKVDLVRALSRGREVRSILDFGCGTGRSLGYLADAFPGASLAGFDESARSVEEAASGVPGARLASDWGAIATGRYDVVFAANVFHHIAPAERGEWLARCRDALSAGGRIFLFEHNPLNPVTRRVFERCPFDAGATMIPRSQALGLMRGQGLRVARTGFTLFFPRPLARLRPLERWLRAVPLGAQYYVEAAAGEPR